MGHLIVELYFPFENNFIYLIQVFLIFKSERFLVIEILFIVCFFVLIDNFGLKQLYYVGLNEFIWNLTCSLNL